MTDFGKQIKRAKRRLEAIRVMIDRAEALGRIPTKNDLSEDDIYLIKSVYGPLPRAFEAAGLKEVTESYREKQRRKRLKRRSK